jgi:MFS family permease
VTYLALLVLAALDAAGYGVIAPVVPEIADRTGAGPTTIGLLVASFALGQLAGYALAGRVVATRGARVVLAASLVLIVAGDLAFVLLSGLEAWFPGRIVQGVGAAGLWLGVTFAVLERWPGEEYRRLTGVLAAYAVGGIAGPALGAADGVSGPFLLHLALTVSAGAAVVVLRRPQIRPTFRSDRAALRTPGFRVAAVGILLVALGLGTL